MNVHFWVCTVITGGSGSYPCGRPDSQPTNLFTFYHIIAEKYSNSVWLGRRMCIYVCVSVSVTGWGGGGGPKICSRTHDKCDTSLILIWFEKCRHSATSLPESVSVVKCETESIIWTIDIKWSKSCTTGRAHDQKKNKKRRERDGKRWWCLRHLASREVVSMSLHFAGLSDMITTIGTCTQLTLLRRIEPRLHV